MSCISPRVYYFTDLAIAAICGRPDLGFLRAIPVLGLFLVLVGALVELMLLLFTDRAQEIIFGFTAALAVWIAAPGITLLILSFFYGEPPPNVARFFGKLMDDIMATRSQVLATSQPGEGRIPGTIEEAVQSPEFANALKNQLSKKLDNLKITKISKYSEILQAGGEDRSKSARPLANLLDEFEASTFSSGWSSSIPHTTEFKESPAQLSSRKASGHQLPEADEVATGTISHLGVSKSSPKMSDLTL
ncbi:unnamed protein product [Cyprideis torosa]|uniref:Uncharacterized protein n=1 Tax=Cyprideis torosa TaxID=163714 RepID=A0A7R8ZPM6_9CRUS|nr:unnamed protein product [Cyprideis torosa]CAG0900916.1 unnamed protein product [Cyprideis torosa]